MKGSSMKTRADRIVPVPASDPRTHSTILDVSCAWDEEVNWHWTMTAQGRFVSGYSIVRRSRNLPDAAKVTVPTRQTRPIGFTADLEQ
jgi:hypothetical protein